MGTPRLDTYLALLSDRQRRRIIHRLRDETAEKTTVGDLVDDLQDGSEPSTEDRPDRDRRAVQLIHNHLPKLDEHGIIRYDRENSIVRYQPDEQIESVLDALPTEVSRTPRNS